VGFCKFLLSLEFENIQYITFIVPVHKLFILILHGWQVLYFLTVEFFGLVVFVLNANMCMLEIDH